jgi:hypothetical protein
VTRFEELIADSRLGLESAVFLTGVTEIRLRQTKIGRSDKSLRILCLEACGEMAEWLKAAVLKTAVRETVPGVRIPLSPPVNSRLMSDLRHVTGWDRTARKSAAQAGLQTDCKHRAALS